MKKKYKPRLCEVKNVKTYRRGDQIITETRINRMTSSQRNTLIVYFHNRGFSNSYIMDLLGVSVDIVNQAINPKSK